MIKENQVHRTKDSMRPHAKKFRGLGPQKNSLVKKVLQPLFTENAIKIQMIPTFSKFAAFAGETKKNGRKQSPIKMKMNPIANNATNHL